MDEIGDQNINSDIDFVDNALDKCDDILSNLHEYQIGFINCKNYLTTYEQFTSFSFWDSFKMLKEQRKILRPMFQHLSRKVGLEEDALEAALLVELDAGPS